MNDGDLALLPSSIRDEARVLSNGEVMQPVGKADAAIEALAALRRVVIGTDVREYQPDGSFIETAWSSFDPDGVDDAAGGCAAALDALRRGSLPGDWVLVTWRQRRAADLVAGHSAPEPAIRSAWMLPDGWTIERVRAVAQGPAEVVPTDLLVIVDEIEPGAERLTVVGTSPLPPRCILRFVDLFLVQDDEDGCWYMGMARPDGVIHCWAGYGDDLEEAIKGL